MSWDGIKRRAEDHGSEPPEVILARVDENIKFLKSGAEAVRIQLHEHEKDDNDKFKAIATKIDKNNNIVLIASGGVGVLVFFIDLLFRR